MSLESNPYQIVILTDIVDLRHDASYKRNVIIGSLKILTFYSSRARVEGRNLQWGFSFYEHSSFFSKALPSCKFRDFDLKNFVEFESLLERLSSANDSQKRRDECEDRCSGCFDRYCDCKRNAPSAVLARCFTEILAAFAWDSPNISSPIKVAQLKDGPGSAVGGRRRRQTRSKSFVSEREAHTNVIVFFSKCPLSRTELEHFTLSKDINQSGVLLEEIMPSGIRKDFHHTKKIELFWIDTHIEICKDDISGLCLMAEALSPIGKLLTLQMLFGARDLSSIICDNNGLQSGTDLNVSKKMFPDSTNLTYFFLKPSVTCLYDNKHPHSSVQLFDHSGYQLAELTADIIIKDCADEILPPTRLMLLGRLPVCDVPLISILPHPVFGIREISPIKNSVWSQMLTIMAKRNMILVLENQCSDGSMPTICLLQALTSLCASLTYLRCDVELDIKKKIIFHSSGSALSKSDLDQLVNEQNIDTIPEGTDDCKKVSRMPLERDMFDPELLEGWLMPVALPSSLTTFLDTDSFRDMDTEETQLLEQLQRTYMYDKSKRLTDVSLTSKKNVHKSPRRKSGRKTCEQQVVRQSPRKSSRTQTAMLARGPGSNQSLPDLERHGRNATAPTRVDLIMQKSKQTWCHSTEELDKKPGHRTSDVSTDTKEEELNYNINSIDELYECITKLHQAALDGEQTPASAMRKVSSLVSSFTSKNKQASAEDILKKSIRLTASDISKKHIHSKQTEKIRDFECQLMLWMESISHGWLADKEIKDQATDEVVMILRRLSFLEDPGALNDQLSDLLARYGESQPSVLCTIYQELGHPLPPLLQAMFSPDDLDASLDSQAPGSAMSFVDTGCMHSTRLQSEKQRTRKILRHTSFHVMSQRQIKVTLPKKDKKEKCDRRRSARIASATKLKQKNVDATDTKQVRRNLFSGGGVKLERSQSVAVMETEAVPKTAVSRLKHKHSSHRRHGSLVTETPTHKQLPDQMWHRKEHHHTETMPSEVMVIEESPDKKTADANKGSSQLGGIANFVRRASFYSGAPDKISRAVKKCEMLEARMTKRLLSPLTKSSGCGLVLTPRRRIQPTVLFSKLLDPSPCKPSRNSIMSPVKTEVSSSTACAGFSSLSKNTRGRMRLFQSPSMKHESPSGSISVGRQDNESSTMSTASFMSPVKIAANLSWVNSPSKNTRFQSRLQSLCQDRATPGSIQRLFQSPPSGSHQVPTKESPVSSAPPKMQWLHQSPGTGGRTSGSSTLRCAPANTPSKSQFTSPYRSQGTPTRNQSAWHDTRTPRKSLIGAVDFASPSRNTRSQSRTFQPEIQDDLTENKKDSDGMYDMRRTDAKLIPSSSSSDMTSSVGFLSSVMTSSAGASVKIFTSAVFTNSLAGQAIVSSHCLQDMSHTLSSLAHTPSKNTRSQTRGSSSFLSSPLPKQNPADSATCHIRSSAISQRLFNSPPQHTPKSSVPTSSSASTDPVNHSPILSPVRGGNQPPQPPEGINRRKRKLSFVASPNKNTATKRQRKTGSTSQCSDAELPALEHFDGDEIFPSAARLTASPDEVTSQRPGATEPLNGPCDELLRQRSTGSGVPSPVFPGPERAPVRDGPSPPSSPVFEGRTPRRQNKENRTKTSELRAALAQFSPQLSKSSISQLVTSPLISPSKQRALRCRLQPASQSPDKQALKSCQTAGQTNENQSTAALCSGFSNLHAGKQKTDRRSFRRMPTKLSL